jgi:hypothetical protein
MRYLINFTETETKVLAYATQDACDAAREAVSARGTTTFVETIADLMELDRDHLARIYNLLKIGDEPIVRSFKTRTDAADRAWDRMARVEPVTETDPDSEPQVEPAGLSDTNPADEEAAAQEAAEVESAELQTSVADSPDVAATAPVQEPVVVVAPTQAKPAQAAPKAPRAPKAPKQVKAAKTRGTGQAAAAEGRPVRAGTLTAAMLTCMLTGTYTAEGIGAAANIPAPPDGNMKGRVMTRMWGLQKNSGIGYSVDANGIIKALLPVNLTPETCIK